MKLLISQYLRLLRERDELDALIPVLFMSMGIIPISHPQIGVRQDGVDIAAVGKDPQDGQDKLFLAVVKKGDIGRKDWNSGPQAIRPSLDEIFDVYLQNNVHPEHKALPIVIWVCTSGNLLQSVNENFVGYAKTKEFKADIVFCGADKLSELIEQYLFNENIFLGEDRKLLRKALVLVGDIDYDLSDYHSLLLSQLATTHDGNVAPQTEAEFQAALTRIHLALNILIAWGDDAGNLKQPLLAAERTVLWTWHAIVKRDFLHSDRICEIFWAIYYTYFKISVGYLNKVGEYFVIKDGMSKVSSNSALISVSIFRQIAILSSIGITAIFMVKMGQERIQPTVERIAVLLRAIIENNRASSSPRLDGNSIDINLALIFFALNGDTDFAKAWLEDLISKLVFVFAKKRYYPISSDNIEDLAQIENDDSDKNSFHLKGTWLVPSVAIWCVLLNMEERYRYFVEELIIKSPDIDPQLWHPTKEAYEQFYFGNSVLALGDTEVPISFDKKISEMKERIRKFKKREGYDLFKFSPAMQQKFVALELLACMHFRIPIPPVLIYSFLTEEKI
jgi:hypothetical protein